MELHFESFDLLGLKKIVESPINATGVLATMHKELKNQYENIFKFLDGFCETQIIKVECPVEDKLTQDNFADLTLYSRMFASDFENKFYDYANSWVAIKISIMDLMRMKQILQGKNPFNAYVLDRYPHVYTFDYEIEDPDVNSIQYYVGIRFRTGADNETI